MKFFAISAFRAVGDAVFFPGDEDDFVSVHAYSFVVETDGQFFYPVGRDEADFGKYFILIPSLSL